MKIRIQQKELKMLRDECTGDCDTCIYRLMCAVLWASESTTKMPNKFGTKDIKSIAEYLKNAF